jgi:Holliday junction resolvase RusA-like endonuclease
MAEVELVVIGEPAPQGSKTRWGTEDNPRTAPWRATISAAAHHAMNGQPPYMGPCALEIEFYFPRPKAHFGSGRNAETLKPAAPTFVTRAPDVDKLVRAVGDALKGYVVRDDAQFAIVRAEKVYGTPRARILVRELDEV